jgi:hypothetical protein
MGGFVKYGRCRVSCLSPPVFSLFFLSLLTCFLGSLFLSLPPAPFMNFKMESGDANMKQGHRVHAYSRRKGDSEETSRRDTRGDEESRSQRCRRDSRLINLLLNPIFIHTFFLSYHRSHRKDSILSYRS